MKMQLCIITKTAVFLVCLLTSTVLSQNLSSLLDAIHEVEAKLTKLINEESKVRKEDYTLQLKSQT